MTEGASSPRAACGQADPVRWCPGTPWAVRAAVHRHGPDARISRSDRPSRDGAHPGLCRPDTAADAEARAALAVDDLERAGGFQRRNLVVFTTTGSGWVDPAMIDLRVPQRRRLRDRRASSTPTCPRGSRTWSTSRRPARPAGPSSTWCTSGGRGCLRTSGRGSTSPARAWGRSAARRPSAVRPTCATAPPGPCSRDHRTSTPCSASSATTATPGSPEIAAAYKNGRTVRFASDPATAIPPPGAVGRHPGALPDAPVGPHRLVEPAPVLQRTDWIGDARQRRARGHGLDAVRDVLAGHRRPTVLDGVPGGHGHKYTTEYVDGWYAVMQPAEVTPGRVGDLRARIG